MYLVAGDYCLRLTYNMHKRKKIPFSDKLLLDFVKTGSDCDDIAHGLVGFVMSAGAK